MFAATPGFVVPTKVPPNKGDNAEAMLLQFNAAVGSQELVGLGACTMRDIMGAPGHLLLAGMLSDRGSPAKGALHVSAGGAAGGGPGARLHPPLPPAR